MVCQLTLNIDIQTDSTKTTKDNNSYNSLHNNTSNLMAGSLEDKLKSFIITYNIIKKDPPIHPNENIHKKYQVDQVILIICW